MLQPWSHVFATPGRRLGCFILFFLYCPILGRPTIVDVRIRSRIVRIHRTRRTIRVVRIVPTTESRFSKPVFQPCSWQIQRSLSRWRTCLLHMDFFISNHLTFKAGVGLRVSIHTPTWGVTVPASKSIDVYDVSIHTPTWGVTEGGCLVRIAGVFQSTLPRGE